MLLPYDPAIALLGIYLKKVTIYVHKKNMYSDVVWVLINNKHLVLTVLEAGKSKI